MSVVVDVVSTVLLLIMGYGCFTDVTEPWKRVLGEICILVLLTAVWL